MADLNSTIVRGNLRVTEEIIGPLNVVNLSTGANGQFLSISNNVPTWVNNPDTNTTYSLVSDANTSGGIEYITAVSFTNGVLTLTSKYLHLNTK